MRLAAGWAFCPDDPRADAKEGPDFGRHTDIDLLARPWADENEVFHGYCPT
jgi:hypothetical protein